MCFEQVCFVFLSATSIFAIVKCLTCSIPSTFFLFSFFYLHCCLLGHCWYWFSSFLLCFLTIICCSWNIFLYATIFATIQWSTHFASNTFSLFLLFELVLLLLLSLLQHSIFAQVSTTCHGYQKTLCCIADNHPPHCNTTTFLWERWNILSIFSPTFGCNCNNNLTQLVNVILHNFLSTSNVVALGFDLGYWVKLQSTTLFFIFMLVKYDDEWWILNFKMSKDTLFDMTNKLKPLIAKKHTKYQLVIHVEVQVACVIYKLSHCSSLLMCNELFAINKSTIVLVIFKVVRAINIKCSRLGIHG